MGIKNFLSNVKQDAVLHAPQLLAGSGTALICIGSVLLCRATLKSVPVLKEHEEALNEVKEKEYENESDRGRDLTGIYLRTCCKIGGLFAAGIVCLGTGLIFVNAGVATALEWNAQSAAACASVTAAFEKYRNNVIEEQGVDADRRYRLGEKGVEKEETVTVKGKEKKVKKMMSVADPNATGNGTLKYITPGNGLYDDDYSIVADQVDAEIKYFEWSLGANRLKYVTLNMLYERLELSGSNYDPNTLIMGYKKGYSEKNPIKYTLETTYIPDANGNLIKAYAIEFCCLENIYAHIENKAKEVDAA